jgi:hypothetical protein
VRHWDDIEKLHLALVNVDLANLHPLHADPVRVQLAVEVGALHAEGLGGAGDVAGELAELGQDVQLLELVARFAERQVRADVDGGRRAPS